MRLKNSIKRIERKLGVGEDWNMLWNKYRDIYIRDERPLHLRLCTPFPPCTIQDKDYELVEWIKDIENGGREMELAKKRIVNSEDFEQSFDGIDLQTALNRRKKCEILTFVYVGFLKELCVASRNNYRIPWLDPVSQSAYRRDIGETNYQKLDRILSRYTKEFGSENECPGYGPPAFKLFREAGQRGDKKLSNFRKQLNEGNSSYLSRKTN